MSSVHNTTSSPTLFAGKNPYTAFARSSFSRLMRSSRPLASSNSFRACSPTTLSLRRCGYLPASSHAMKNGDQSMYGTISASGKSRSSRTPVNAGRGIGPSLQSMRNAFLQASA